MSERDFIMQCQEKDCKGMLNTKTRYHLKVGNGINESHDMYLCSVCRRLHTLMGRLYKHPKREGRPFCWIENGQNKVYYKK